jgi:hypothetical protein
MIKINVNPLVLAAALGLLGPAALIDDDDDATIGGLWERVSDGDEPIASRLPARLGSQLQLLPIEDAFVIDDGSQRDNGSWTKQDIVSQTIDCVSGQVRREFLAEGDALTVHTIVTRQDKEDISYSDVYTRVT